MRMVGDGGLIKSRHDYEEDMKSKAFNVMQATKVNPIYKMGETVEATMIGVIDSITVTELGNVIYRLTDDDNNTHGFFKESQVCELLQPEDLHEPMEEKIEEEA